MSVTGAIQRFVLTVLLAASCCLPLPALAAKAEQFFMLPSYRTGPYGANGSSWFGGFIDYLAYVNIKGGINGLRLTWEECETEYNTAKGIACYERLKAKAGEAPGPIHAMSTGIAYALIDRTAHDRLPLAMVGHGVTAAVDGSVFPWAFPLVTTYQMQASAIFRFIRDRSGGSLAGRKIAYLYHDSPYGNEPIAALEAEARHNGFELLKLPVEPPGNEQREQWQNIRAENPDYIILWGWGRMNAVALRNARQAGFPSERIIGSWWAGTEEDVLPAGDAAKGYIAATWNLAGRDLPLIAEIEKTLYEAGKGNLRDRRKIGSILYNRGVSAAVLSVEAVRTAQSRFGKGRPMNPEQVRWGLENIDLDAQRLKELGATELLPEVRTSCSNHEGSGRIRMQQWDGLRWVALTDWIEGDRELIYPLFQASAAKYAKEKNIRPRNCMAEEKKGRQILGR